MTRKYRRFSKEFKIEAVRLAEESDKPVSQVAREPGICVNQIYKWKQELEVKSGRRFPDMAGRVAQRERSHSIGKSTSVCAWRMRF